MSSKVKVGDVLMRKALAQLKPPSTTAVLDADMLKTMNKLNTVLGRSKREASEIQRLLDAHTSKVTSPKHTHRPAFHLSPFFRFPLSPTSIISVVNSDLYLPTDSPSALAILVPPEHRYFDNEIGTPTVFGSASASKANGVIDAIQSVNLNSAQDSSWAAIFITFGSDRAASISITPEVDWTYFDYRHVDSNWADRTAHLDGWINFAANIWLIAFEWNTGTNSWDQLPSPVRFQLWQSSAYVTSQSQSGMSGSLQNGLPYLQEKLTQ